MDRDRDWRLRDIPPEDRFGTGGGQSYRPGAAGRDRSPPPRRSPIPSRVDSYRSRDRSPIPRVDSYTPIGRGPPLRPRSRSPPLRGDTYRRRSPTPPRYRDGGRPGGDSYRGRPRSPPPPRRELPRDDLFRREPPRPPPRDFRYRDRSPLPLKRGRDPSPVHSRGRRTPPPPLKRERLASPPPRSRYDNYPPSRGVSPPPRVYSPLPPRGAVRDYRIRSRSPMTRSDRVDSRPASPPQKYARGDYYDDDSGRVSVSTSRRSSPPVHPSRLGLQGPLPEDRRPPPRDPYVDERPPYRARSPARRISPAPSRDHEMRDYDRSHPSADDRVPTPREPAVTRAPPSGPAGSQYAPPTGPPTGPAAAQASTPAPLQPRAQAAPPSGPRGDTSSRGGFAPRGRGGYGADFAARGRGAGYGTYRGGRGGAPPPITPRASSYDQREPEFSAPTGPTGNPPSGPRASFSQPHQQGPPLRPAGNQQAGAFHRLQRFPSNGAPGNEPPTGPKSSTMAPFPRRSIQQSPPVGPSSLQSPTNNLVPPGSSIPTGPSADRRPSAPPVHPALLDLSKIIEGGQKLEPLTDRTRLGKLEEESERLRRQIEDKEIRKKRAVREWDRLQREAETAALRSELAENSVRKLSGEEESMAAF